MSDGLSRSIRSIRPVVSAKTRTLFATAAAQKSAEMENWRVTLSTLKIGLSWRVCMMRKLGYKAPEELTWSTGMRVELGTFDTKVSKE